MPFDERTDWVDTPSSPPPPGSTPVYAGDILRWERGIAEAHEELDTRLSDAALNATYGRVKTVNGQTPNAEGNVAIEAAAPSDAQLATAVTAGATKTALDARYTMVREAPLDVRRYGADGTGVADSRLAIQAAVDAARDAGGGTVLIDGTYRVDAPIVPRDNVTLMGRGWGKSIIMPPSTWNNGNGGSIIQAGGSVENPIDNFFVRDIKFDLSQIPTLVDAKALFVTFMKNLRFENNWVLNSTATGVGADFLDGGVIRGNRVEGCGRAAATIEETRLGCSGIGIGTGAWGSEATLVDGNFVINPVRYGIFVEYQSGISGHFTWGCKIVNNYIDGAYWGIGSDGVAYMHVIGNHVENSDKDGISIAPGNAGGVSYGDLIALNTIRKSGRHGMFVDFGSSGNGTPAERGRMMVVNNRFMDNTSCGMKFSSSGALPNMQINGNMVSRNGAIGLDIGGGGINDSTIESNVFTDNVTAGIRLLGRTTRVAVRNNRSGDSRTTGRTQQVGLLISSGITVEESVISGNDFTNNTSNTVAQSGATLTSVQMRNNRGLGPDAVEAVTVTTSPMTYTVTSRPERLLIAGGEVTSVDINGQAWLAGPGSLDLEPNDVVTITYTTAPTSIKRRRL